MTKSHFKLFINKIKFLFKLHQTGGEGFQSPFGSEEKKRGVRLENKIGASLGSQSIS
jgi:hypothetical protein